MQYRIPAIDSIHKFFIKGALGSCGEFDKKAKWAANPIPVPPTRTPTRTPTATQPRPTATIGVLITPVGWATLRTQRFALMVPPGFYSQVALRDVQMKPGSAQLIFMGLDRETGFGVDVTESPALYHSAQKMMESRKGDLAYSSTPAAVLLAQSNIKINGKEAAVLEYVKSDLAIVMYFIATEQEEFEIVIHQANRNDEKFIASAERIANSFMVDVASNATPAR